MTLRERIHEFMHVGERETWICETNPDLVCPLYKTVVNPLAAQVEEWLREKAAEGPYSDSADYWLTWLADELQEQQA